MTETVNITLSKDDAEYWIKLLGPGDRKLPELNVDSHLYRFRQALMDVADELWKRGD